MAMKISSDHLNKTNSHQNNTLPYFTAKLSRGLMRSTQATTWSSSVMSYVIYI